MRLVLLAMLLSAALFRTGSAQDPSDLAAYRALTQTPLGGLIAPSGPAVSGEPSGWGWHVQYGLRSLDDHEYTHTAGAGIELPLRMLIWQDPAGTHVGYLDPRELADRYALDGHQQTLERQTAVLAKLAAAAAG